MPGITPLNIGEIRPGDLLSAHLFYEAIYLRGEDED